MRTVSRSVATVVVVLSVLGGAACSDDSSSDAGDASTTAAATEPSETSAVPTDECGPSDPEPPVTEPVPDVASDLTLTSFDGTALRIHWFPATDVDGPVPTLLEGPGWGLAGSMDTGDAPGIFGDLSVASLRAAGYNVLTWDPRGFGQSEGTITIDAAEHEGRDVQRLLDWVATQPEVQLDAPGDPRVGMLGGSYGGGIANTTAAIDCRVDAIAPSIAWSSLRTSLYKGDIVKTGWADLLYNAAAGRDLDPHIVSAHESGEATGTISDEDVAWFESRGPGERIADITVPTLIIQGTVDTLFTLDEAVANHALLREAGTPVWMLWFCGGHGICLSEPGGNQWTGEITMEFFDRFLRGNDAAAEPPAFAFVDQHGDRWRADAFPEATTTLDGSGAGGLDLVAEGGSGPAIAPEGGPGVIGGLALEFTPSRATNAVEVPIVADADAFVVGAPTLRITYSGTVDDGERPTRLFAQLVDDANDLVLGNQVTPIVVELDGAEHTVELPLETVAHRLRAGERLTLQIVATTTAYATPRLGGTVDLTAIEVSLPVVEGITPL